jgi:hypothetical protein
VIAAPGLDTTKNIVAKSGPGASFETGTARPTATA